MANMATKAMFSDFLSACVLHPTNRLTYFSAGISSLNLKYHQLRDEILMLCYGKDTARIFYFYYVIFFIVQGKVYGWFDKNMT